MAEVSRRTVLRSSAWSLPVVALAVATPAAAASVTSALRLDPPDNPYYGPYPVIIIGTVTLTEGQPKPSHVLVFISSDDYAVPAQVAVDSSNQFFIPVDVINPGVDSTLSVASPVAGIDGDSMQLH
jgi:predicted alpha/beta hydrolase family esterase